MASLGARQLAAFKEKNPEKSDLVQLVVALKLACYKLCLLDAEFSINTIEN
jgi:hypothetical protein